MNRKIRICLLLFVAALLLDGCALRTVDELYCLPKRSKAYDNLQAVIDEAMDDLEYSAPLYGENPQVVQTADLDGDGTDEYLLFARDDSEKPLKILIFAQLASGYMLMDTIEGYGFAYDFVTYAEVDDHPGVEIVVGRLVSEDVVRSVSVYRFTSGFSRQLLTTGYSRMVTEDLDGDGLSELFLLNAGVAEGRNGVVTYYGYEGGELQRSAGVEISASASNYRSMTAGLLQDGTPAVYLTSAKDDKTLVTDVFTMRSEQLVPVCKGIETPALHNYFVYTDDMDDDGIQELPRLLPVPGAADGGRQQYLIEWYSVNAAGRETAKLYTYHNYIDNWYITLDAEWVDKVAVEKAENNCRFYYLDPNSENPVPVLTVSTLVDADKNELAAQEGRIVLYSSDTVIYVADLEEAAEALGITEEIIIPRFSPIRADMNVEED